MGIRFRRDEVEAEGNAVVVVDDDDVKIVGGGSAVTPDHARRFS